MRKIKKPNRLNSNIKKGLMVAIPLTTVCLASSCSLDQKVEYEYSRISFSSDGKYSESKQFKPYDSEGKTEVLNSFMSYSAWVLNEDGKYQRDVKEYNVKRKTYEDVKGLENNNEQIKEVLGEPTKSYIQIKDTISEEDIERGAYYEATLYSMDNSNYVTVKTGDPSHILILTGCLVAFTVGGAGLIAIQKKEEKDKPKKLELKR